MGDVLTMAQAAGEAGVTRSGLSTLVYRARLAGVDLYAPASTWPDKRSPLVDAERLRAYLASRPGRGPRSRAGQRSESNGG